MISSTEQTTWDPLMLAYGEQILNGLVYEMYFPKELHAADLRLFDLVATADLPEITQLPKKPAYPHSGTNSRISTASSTPYAPPSKCTNPLSIIDGKVQGMSALSFNDRF